METKPSFPPYFSIPRMINHLSSYCYLVPLKHPLCFDLSKCFPLPCLKIHFFLLSLVHFHYLFDDLFWQFLWHLSLCSSHFRYIYFLNNHRIEYIIYNSFIKNHIFLYWSHGCKRKRDIRYNLLQPLDWKIVILYFKFLYGSELHWQSVLHKNEH